MVKNSMENLNFYLFLGFALFAGCVVLAFYYRASGLLKRGYLVLSFGKRDYLLSPAERSFYGVLLSVLDSTKYVVFPKVRLLDIIYPYGAHRFIAFNKIQSKHIDFLICDTKKISPLLAVELDDASHKFNNRQQRDEFLESALITARLNLCRFQVKASYISSDVKESILKCLNGG